MWRHSADLAVVDSGDRIAVLDLTRLDLPPRLLEGSAAVIWRAADGERATSELVASVAAWFGIEEGEIEGDVVAFLAALADDGLLETS